jgi:hypothetical protein
MQVPRDLVEALHRYVGLPTAAVHGNAAESWTTLNAIQWYVQLTVLFMMIYREGTLC